MALLKLTPNVPTEVQVQASITDTIRKLGLGEVVRYNSGGVWNAESQFVRFNDAKGHSDLAGVQKVPRLLPGSKMARQRPHGVAGCVSGRNPFFRSCVSAGVVDKEKKK
jgi:hypothetical protein